MVWISLDRAVTGSLMVDCTSYIVEAGLSTGVERITHSSSSLLSPSPVMCSGEGSLVNEGTSLFLKGVALLGLPHVASLGVSEASPSLSESSFVVPSCLNLPCRGSRRFLCRTLGLPPCNALDHIDWDTRGGLIHYLVFFILPVVLDLMPAFPGCLLN